MAITPKKTKHKLTFRNKIQTQKVTKYDHTIIRPSLPLWVYDNRKDQVDTFTTLVPKTKQTQHSVYYNLALRTNIAQNCFLTGWYKNCSADATAGQIGYGYNIGSQVQNSFTSRISKDSAYMSYDYTKHLLFGKYGIIFQTHGLLRAKHVETLRLDIAKQLKKRAKMWLRICCDTPVTSRPVETRMGKGKGAISHYEAKVTPGQVFFELDGLHLATMHQIFQNISKKSSLRLKLVSSLG